MKINTIDIQKKLNKLYVNTFTPDNVEELKDKGKGKTPIQVVSATLD